MLAAIGCATGEQPAVDGGDVESVDAGVVDGPLADAGVDGGCVESWINVLDNADFEAGNSVWNETTNGAQAVIREVGAGLPFNPEAGSWAALIGGFNGADIDLSQPITVPDDATALRFAGFRCWVTEESAGAVDLLSIELRDDTGAPLETLLSISNEDAAATCAWEPFEIDAAEPRAGEAVTLGLAGTTDGATVTSFAFDTLALEAQVCR